MNIRSLFVFLMLLLSASIAAAQAAPSKVGIVDSGAFFDEKAGVTKLVAGMKLLNDGFKTTQTELDTLNKRLQTLATEIDALQKQPNPDQRLLQTKAAEGEQLQRNIKYKTEDAKERYAREEARIIGPIMQAIGKGLQEYAKAKGFTLIFDVSKDQNGFLVAIGDQAADVTKDFVAFYNAKP
jgi:Skp family chaperone for outer membrane proteins